MEKEITIDQKILKFYEKLSKILLDIPEGFKMINPYNNLVVKDITTKFYNKFYNDNKKRRMILGSSPARRGTAVTGVPYEDAAHLQKETGIFIDNFYVNKSSSNFLYDVMELYGGCEKFYAAFYMNFVCPLGIARINQTGNEVNCNYYENKNLKKNLYDFIVNSIKEQLTFNIDTSVCYSIGSGENYKFLLELNEKYKFFEKIIPLEHPRFIMQYNSKNKDMYLKKYMNALKYDKEGILHNNKEDIL